MEHCIETQPTKQRKSQKKTSFESKYSSEEQDSYDNNSTETHSSYSCSFVSKHSPEYSSGEGEEKTLKSKILPIIRKGIHKFYEPIQDSGSTFKYEENPNEYKKARKRIQNRESASRVRNRKKTYVEELEGEMDLLKSENDQIRMRLAQLEAENNLLRSQSAYIEKPYSSPVDSSQADPCADYFIPMGDIKEEEDEYEPLGSPSMNFIRYDSNVSNRNHITLLGIFAVILCTVGIVGPDAKVSGSSGVFANGEMVFTQGKSSHLGWYGMLVTMAIAWICYLVYTVNRYRSKGMPSTKRSGRVSL